MDINFVREKIKIYNFVGLPYVQQLMQTTNFMFVA